MERNIKRLMALLLTMILFISGLPVGGLKVWAADGETVVISTEKDVYVQGGGDKDKVMGNNRIFVKTPLSGQLNSSVHRKGLVEFDLTQTPENCNTAYLKLQIASFGKNFTSSSRGAIYMTETGWEASEMTWSSFPDQRKKVTEFTWNNIDGNQGADDYMIIDVSSAVEEALENGEKAISFEITLLNPNGAADMAIYFYRHNYEGKTGPQLELSYDAQKEQEKEMKQIFDGLRTKWKNYLVGDNLDLNDSTVKNYVNTLNDTANTYWNNMNKSDNSGRLQLWDDIEIIKSDGSKAGSAMVHSNFKRLYTLALAYKTQGCELYQNNAFFKELMSGIRFMVDTYYNGSTSKSWGNWWEWEIGIPQSLCSTLLVLFEDISEQEIKDCLTGVERYASTSNSAGISGSPTMTGANLLDKVLVVAQTGILTDNPEKMEHAKTAQKKAYHYVKSGDGFYEDGSFIQHGSLACTSDYGRKMYKCIGELFYMLDDTPWEVVYEDGSETIVYDGIFEMIEPLIYDGQFADSTAGRGVSRPTENTRTRTVGIMESLLLIGTTMEGGMKESFERMAKYQIGVDETYFYEHAANITAILLAKDIMENEDIQPRSEYSIHKTYAGMDRVSHVRSSYMFNISMSSTRRSKFENFNGEGKRLWNIADGMTYLYTDDLSQYTNDYWATIDPHRLPGTTAERALNRPAFTSHTVTGKTPYNWAGGVTLDNYGTAGVQMKALGNETKGNGSQLTGADSKKSWFMFDDEIVAIGSSITSNTGNSVDTIIDNRQIEKDLSNVVTINGETPDIIDNSDNNNKEGTIIEDVQWVNIQGSTQNSTIGYYFPENDTVIHALKERRDGNYNTQHYTNKAVSGSYATIWMNHGANPENESYEYVILPGMTAEETKAYAENPQIEVLENSDDAHAVRHNGLNMTGVNFWKDEEKTAAGITSSKKASVMMWQKGDILEISVADPTQANNGTIELKINKPCSQVLSKDDTVSAEMSYASLKLTVDVAGAMGKSHSIKLRISDLPIENAVIKAEEPDFLQVEKGIPFSELPLPESVRIYTSNNAQYEAAVNWSNAGYDKDCEGVYKLSGLIRMPEGVTNPEGVIANIVVRVGDVFVKASQDTYVRDNSETGADHKADPKLQLKNDGKGYSRKAIIKFPLENILDNADKIYFMFEFAAVPNATFSDMAVYQTAADWDESSVQWDNFPDRIGEKAASVTIADVQQGLGQKVDVTTQVMQAVADGASEISFELSIPDYSKDNYAAICSLEHETGQVPTLYFEKIPNPEVTVDKTALQALYDSNLNWNKVDFTVESWNNLQEALENARKILENVEMENEVTQEEVDKAVSVLQEALQNLRLAADQEKLTEAVAHAEEVIASGEYLDDEKMQIYKEVLQYAKDMLEDAFSTDTEYKTVIRALEAAEAELNKKPEDVFVDVKPEDWYYSCVYGVYEKGWMTGLSKTVFGPAQNMTRAQFATVLYRMEGSPKVSYDTRFEDVKDGEFYSQAVIWANNIGVIRGYEDGRFGPSDEITREQMATLIYRYAQYQKKDVLAEGDLETFPDGDKVSVFANEAMKWCVGVGLIRGNGLDGTLAPQDKVPRAVGAMLILRYMEMK